jgi:hypothetical protein
VERCEGNEGKYALGFMKEDSGLISLYLAGESPLPTAVPIAVPLWAYGTKDANEG